MGWIRLALRLTMFSLFLAGTCLLAAGLCIADRFRSTPIDRNPWSAWCFRRACQCLGWQIGVHGHRSEGHALYVANHISWSDIPVLGSITPLRFLSKSEVGHWPIIGWLARQAGTLFIRRGGGQARRIKAEMSKHLAAGESVLIYPEGTTSSGLAVLPMHGLMLSAARDAGVPIQPVTIGYRRQHRPDALAPFMGDDSFHHHLIRLLKQSPMQVELVFHPQVDTSGTDTINELTRQIHQTISDGLKRIHAGEFDSGAQCTVRTAGDPELSHLP
ncbi:MAG TPA: lysophospholipid acyltransferase family protein [Marinobacter sp.]|nr:lysophospholipid acyltransferase family protein [Marinobacter sp.]